MTSLRVLVVDDQETIREALAEVISSSPGLTLAGTAAHPAEAITSARELQPDVAVVDVKMPDGGGVRVARELRTVSPNTCVIAWSAEDDIDDAMEMLREGAASYIRKSTRHQSVVDAILDAHAGRTILRVDLKAMESLRSALSASPEFGAGLAAGLRWKRELIQTMYHELFTPITSIQLFAQSLGAWKQMLSPREIEELARGLASANARLHRLAGNIASAALLDREAGKTQVLGLSVRAIVNDAVADIADPRISISSSARAETPVLAQHDLAVRALVAVVENALEYSPADEGVTIAVQNGPKGIAITVHDRGHGIQPDQRKTIFEPFTQGDSSSTRSHEGIGLGLYVAMRAMQELGGTILVRDRVGGGSVFSLRFRRAESDESRTDA
jgi:two-component system response regulator DevR